MRTTHEIHYGPQPDADLADAVVVQLRKRQRHLSAGLIDTTTPEFQQLMAALHHLRRGEMGDI